MTIRKARGLPLAPTNLRGMCAMINLIGAIPDIAQIPTGVHAHLYHKAPRPGRKVGHLTLVARDMATLMRKVEECRPLAGVWLPPSEDALPPPKVKRPKSTE